MSLIIFLSLCFKSCSWKIFFTCKFKFDAISQTVGGHKVMDAVTKLLEKVVGIN